MEEQYRRIDPASLDFRHARWAQKVAEVHAVPAVEGERVNTVMSDGHAETTNIAQLGDLKITNPSGEQYLVHADVFRKRYHATGKPGIFAPEPRAIHVIRVDENVEFRASWGKTIRIKSGGLLGEIAPGDVNGIEGPEFKETYQYVPDPGASSLPTKPGTMH